MGGRGAVSYAGSIGSAGGGLLANRVLRGAGFSEREVELFHDFIIDKGGDGVHGPVAELHRWQSGEDLGAEKNAYYKEMDAVVEKYIAANASPQGTIYRGVRLSNKDLKKYGKKGAVTKQLGTSSWSHDENVAALFSGRRDIGLPNNVLFVVHNAKGAADATSFNSGESELWSSKNQRYRTVDHYTESINGWKTHVIVLEEC